VKHLVKVAENIDVGQRNSPEVDRLEGRAPITFDDNDVERVIMDYVMATHTEADAGDEHRGLSATEHRKKLTLGAAWQWQLFAIKRPGDVRWNFLNSNFVRVPPMQDRKDLVFHTDVEVACNVTDKGKDLRANVQVHSHVPRTNSIAINPFTGLGRHILSNIQTGVMNFPFLLDTGHTHTQSLSLQLKPTWSVVNFNGRQRIHKVLQEHLRVVGQGGSKDARTLHTAYRAAFGTGV
jgi:hypothetical protein